MVEQKEFKIKLMVVGIKKSILKQLPVRDVSKPQLSFGEVNLLCWIKGDALWRDTRGVYVLCEHRDGSVFLWRLWHPHYERNWILVYHDGDKVIRVPWAVVA